MSRRRSYHGRSRRRADKPRFRRFGVFLIVFVLVIAAASLLLDMRVRPIVLRTSAYQSRILASNIINDALTTEFANGEYSYESLAVVQRSADGIVSSVEINTQLVNRIKSRSAMIINQSLKEIDQRQLDVSMGTVSGIQFLYGRGPRLPIHIEPKGYAEIDMRSEFTQAGINQVLHRIMLYVKVNISAIIPGYTQSVEMETPFVVAEIVIVGKIPDAYTEINI